MNRFRIAVCCVLAATGVIACGSLPSSEVVQVAQGHVNESLSVSDTVRRALVFFGILPSYECGGDERTDAAQLLQFLKAKVACAQVSDQPGETSDTLVLTFPAGGCDVDGHSLGGEAQVTVAQGTDHDRVVLNVDRMTFDGKAMNGTLGRETCGDQTTYWVTGHGTLPKGNLVYSVDLHARVRDGGWFGSTELLLNGTGQVQHGTGTDQVTFTDLSYDIGDFLPHGGSLAIATDKHSVEASFSEGSWKVGQASVVVDGSPAVSIPVVQ